jgi:hypothetical protein
MAHTRPLLMLAIVSGFGLLAPPAQAQDAQPAPAPPALAAPAPPALAAPAPPTLPPPAAAVTYQGYQPARQYDGPPLLLGRRTSVGGYGGLTAAYTRMLDRDGGLVGFEGALLLAHRLSLGVAAFGFSRDPAGPPALDGGKREFGAGYGGFVIRYAPWINLPVYPAFGVLIGGGAAVLHRDDFDHDDSGNDDDAQADGFFVAQPEVTLHANLTRWMRVGVNAGYRLTSGVSRFGLTESDLNGVVLGGHIQFGWI